MDFNKLQTMQRDLDQTILGSKPEMTKEERFTKTLVALSVELAEVANCAEHFKFWKENKGKVDGKRFDTAGWFDLDERFEYKDLVTFESLTKQQAHKLTLVDECADALHFVLSLANQLDINVEEYAYLGRKIDLSNDYFYMRLQYNISSLHCGKIILDKSYNRLYHYLESIIINFINYIYTLGVSHEELEQAYYDKHKVNYKRQEEGY